MKVLHHNKKKTANNQLQIISRFKLSIKWYNNVQNTSEN